MRRNAGFKRQRLLIVVHNLVHDVTAYHVRIVRNIGIQYTFQVFTELNFFGSYDLTIGAC